MDNQIGIPADWTREMQIIRLGQTVMAKRLPRVPRSLQTFEETNFERLLFWFAANRGEKSLHFFALREIAHFVTETQNEFPIFAELFWIGIFMNAINRRNRAMPKFARDRFVGGEHKFFDQLVRLFILDPVEPRRFAVFIDINFHFRKIEIERAMLEPFTP